MPSTRVTTRILAWALGLLVAARLMVLLLGVGRGLELGDEGFLLLNWNRPREAPPLFGFYALLAPFDLSLGVRGIRGLRIATEVLASALLVLCAFVWGRHRHLLPARAGGPGLAAFAATASLGAFLSTASRAFGYNDLSNLCVFGAAGGLLVLDSLPERVGARGPALAFGIGALIGLQLLVKFPAALVLLLVAGAFVALGAGPARERGRRGAALALGVALAPAAFVAVIGGPGALAQRLAEAGLINRLTGYGVGEILWRYLWADVDAWAQLLLLALVVGGVAAALGRLRGGGESARDRAWALGLLVGALVLAASARRLHPFWVHPSLIHWLCSLLYVAVAFAWGWVRATRADAGAHAGWARTLAGLALLAALPFVLIAGTNVPLSIRLPTHALPLALAVALLGGALAGRGRPRTALAALGVLAVSSSWVFVEHQLRAPYGLAAPLYRQTEPLAWVPGVRVDAASRAFLDGVREALLEAGYRPGDAIIAFDYMPGLVFHLGGRSPGFPFYVFDNPALNCFGIDRAGRTEGPLRPFLVLGRPMSERQRACIDAFDFPADFRELARLPNPYAGVYARSFGGPGMQEVALYAPRR